MQRVINTQGSITAIIREDRSNTVNNLQRAT